MKLSLELKLQNVYGGDGFTRPHTVDSIKLSRSKTKTRTRQDLGVPVESEMAEQETEKKFTTCHTFKRDEDNVPILRLGGVHGKFWGAMKEAAQVLKDSNTGDFNSFSEIERLMRTVNVIPIYARLEGTDGMTVEALPQILAGRRSSMITQYFDVIPECTTKIELIFPDAMSKKVDAILNQLPELGILNKRRTTVHITKGDK